MLDAYFSATEIADIVMSCVHHAVMVTDMEGRILFAGPGSRQVLGYGPEELQGRSLSILFTPEDMTYFYENLFTLARRQESFEGQIMLMRKDQSRFFAFMIMKPRTNSSEEKNIVVVSLQDIDREKRIERSMRENQYEDLVKIANGVAHELRNPLVSIGGFMRRLYKSCRSVDEHDRYYEFILVNLKKIERLVEKVDAFSMIPKPCLVLESVKSIVERTLVLHADDFKNKAVQLNLELEEMVLRADQALVSKALSVLIENALDALPKGGKLSVSCASRDTEWRLSVTDNGCGIDPKDMPFLFNPFFSTKADGAGIDLAGVKRIMDSLSGRVEVTSTKGKGTTFVLVFPVEKRRAIRIAPLD